MFVQYLEACVPTFVECRGEPPGGFGFVLGGAGGYLTESSGNQLGLTLNADYASAFDEQDDGPDFGGRFVFTLNGVVRL
jgi:hypothetical protein